MKHIVQGKRLIILLILLLQFFWWGCRKNEEEWDYCNGCRLSEWTGTFSGNGHYYSFQNDNQTVTLPVTVIVDSIASQTLKITVASSPEFSWTYTGQKNDNSYWFDLVGSTQSLDMNLYRKGDEYKISGTAKRYHIPKPDSVVVDESVSFDVFKNR